MILIFVALVVVAIGLLIWMWRLPPEPPPLPPYVKGDDQPTNDYQVFQ